MPFLLNHIFTLNTPESCVIYRFKCIYVYIQDLLIYPIFKYATNLRFILPDRVTFGDGNLTDNVGKWVPL